jgi:hypothetical protein
MNSLPIEWTTDVVEGAHRLRLTGHGTRSAWSAAIACLSQRLADQRYWSAWDVAHRLDFIAADVDDDGATVYLAGSTSMWRGASTIGLGVPPVDVAVRSLAAAGGRLDRVTWESKPLETAGYERVTGGAKYPWPIHFAESEVRTVRPVGAITGAQLDALAVAMAPAVRMAATAPLSLGEPATVLVNDGVRLAQTVPANMALELIFVWWQLCWVNMDRIELLGDGEGLRDGDVVLTLTWGENGPKSV